MGGNVMRICHRYVNTAGQIVARNGITSQVPAGDSWVIIDTTSTASQFVGKPAFISLGEHRASSNKTAPSTSDPADTAPLGRSGTPCAWGTLGTVAGIRSEPHMGAQHGRRGVCSI